MQSTSSAIAIRRLLPWGLGALSLGLTGCAGNVRTPASQAGLPALTAPVEAASPKPRRAGTIRIGLESLKGRPSLPVKFPSTGRILDGITGEKIKAVPANLPLVVSVDYATGEVRASGRGVEVRRPALALSGGLVRVSGRRYPGVVRFTAGGTGLQLTNELESEQYLEGVLPGEIPASFGVEAQKALAVAARTYALAQAGKHGDFDLCDRTCCQMYLGYHRGSARGLAAVRATRNMVLRSGGDLAYAFYSADCGGISTDVEEVPLRDKPAHDLPYLTVVRDAPRQGPDYCATSPYHRWTKRLERQALEDRLNKEPETYIGRLQDVRVTDYDPSGRIRSVVLRGETPPDLSGLTSTAAVEPIEKTVTGWRFRNAVGARTLKSTLLKIDQPEPGVFRFTGRGNGHGLGLCQIGANGMAKRGFRFQQILSHYYPGTKLEDVRSKASG